MSRGKDQRESPRYPAGPGVRGDLVVDIGEPLPGRVINVSTGGICLSLAPRVDIEPGTILTVDLRNTETNVAMKRSVRVVYVQERGETECILGCAFASKLTDDDVRRLL